MWTTQKLKERFFKYFEKSGHIVLPSSSVIPNNDPTLLFANSGMVQFKNIFLGEKTNYKRVITSQRCIRAGGKHNDLDDVGKDNYHHTFFEMLGNWSFGDYFKEDAIRFAYDFLINDLKLNRDNIYVTVYQEMDQESVEIWKKYVDPSRIIPSSRKDNFWEMGEFGPCGPCTEIHYDRIGNRDASSLVNKDDPDVIEIWNVVFMEYENTPRGLEKLKVKHIDTGIGLERLLSILMNVRSNYLIDSFQHIIGFLEMKTGLKYEDKNSVTDVAFRVLSDHARTIATCLNDKVCFSSEGVGYVLRRILRRAVRYAHDILKVEKGVIAQCVARAAEFFDYKIDVSIVDAEEELFLKTLVKGLNQLVKMAEVKGELDGSDVFLLYDTYGFPCDLTELVAKEKNIKYNLSGFEEAKNKAREMSKSSKKFITVNFDFPKTDDSFKYTVNNLEATLQAIVYKNEIVEEIPNGEIADLIFERTCFYGESGGQIGDKGTINFFENNKKVGTFTVSNTSIQRGYVLHEGTLEGKVTENAVLTYDEELRRLTRANHSTVYILNYFLRTYIKTDQQGSLVDSEKARFDFESKKLSDEVLAELEEKINQFVSTNAKVEVTTHPKEEILSDDSIIKMPNEEYPDVVRVINMDNGSIKIREICGGTHVANTSEIKLVRILSESGVKANTRRIVAVSSDKAIEADENAKRLRSLQEKGEVVAVDCLLSISQKKTIETVNRENTKKLQKAIDLAVSELKESLKEKLVTFKVSNMLKNEIFSYDCSLLSKFPKKDQLKSISILVNVLDCAGYLYIMDENDVFFIAKSKEIEKLNENISKSNKIISCRVIKDTVQGNIKTSEFCEKEFSKNFD